MGIGPLDIALWDLAGKHYGASVAELLGIYRTRVPAYASTYHGDDSGGLDSPSAYADFAAECHEMGYPGFKIHGWGGSNPARDIDRGIETVHAVGERVGDEMDLLFDPACEYETFGDALNMGRACDEHGFFWYEDPYRDGGISQHARSRLRERLETALLQTEHVRGLEPATDFVASGATDFVRADPEYDGGITGAMKRARIAEGFGLDVEFHAPGPAQRHCIAATRNTNYYEMALVHPDCRTPEPPVYAGGYDDELEAVDDDGYVEVPDGPGLGVEYDWDFIEPRGRPHPRGPRRGRERLHWPGGQAILSQRENPAVYGGRESRQRRDVFARSARLHTQPRRHARPHVGTIGQSRDSDPALAGYPLRKRHRIPTQNTKVPPNPPQDRSNGGVALPSLVGVQT